MVGAEALLRIFCRGRYMCLLHCSRRGVSFSREPLLFRRRVVPNAARSASIGYMVVIDDGCVVHDRLVHVGVVNDGRIHPHHGSIVGKVATAPFAASEADAHISESVVDAAVVADVLSPVA